MTPAPYIGYHAPDGTGRAVDVRDFEDERASAVLRATREHELLQMVHRARPYRAGDPQMTLVNAEQPSITRLYPRRPTVRIILHTAHPVPGLRVDELRYADEGDADQGDENEENRRRADDAA